MDGLVIDFALVVAAVVLWLKPCPRPLVFDVVDSGPRYVQLAGYCGRGNIVTKQLFDLPSLALCNRCIWVSWPTQAASTLHHIAGIVNNVAGIQVRWIKASAIVTMVQNPLTRVSNKSEPKSCGELMHAVVHSAVLYVSIAVRRDKPGKVPATSHWVNNSFGKQVILKFLEVIGLRPAYTRTVFRTAFDPATSINPKWLAAVAAHAINFSWESVILRGHGNLSFLRRAGAVASGARFFHASNYTSFVE